MIHGLKVLIGGIYCALRGIKCGRNVSITPPMKVRCVNGGVLLGDNVSISASTILLGVTPQAKIIFGNNIRIAHHFQISCANTVNIGSDVNIAPFVFISDHNHKFEDPNKPIKDQGISIKEGGGSSDRRRFLDWYKSHNYWKCKDWKTLCYWSKFCCHERYS